MPDFLKKTRKRTAAICGDDDRGIAALFVRPRQGDKTKKLGAPGGVLAKVSVLADDTDADEPRAELASMLDRNVVLVLTRTRMLAFVHGSLTGRVGDLVGEVALADIERLELDAPPVGESGAAALEIDFADGSSAVVTPGSRRRRFAEAFAQLQEPAS